MLRAKFVLALTGAFLFILGAIVGGFVVVWPDLSDSEKAILGQVYGERAGLLLLFACFLLIALGALLYQLFQSYLLPPKALTEDINVMMTANPGHRTMPRGAVEMRELAGAVNRFAEAHQTLMTDVATKIRAAGTALEEEKNRLGALMSELSQSVLVCNSEGRILLYNSSARHLFELDKHVPGGTLVGLGRSIFGVVERGLITHALEDIRYRLQQGSPRPSAAFVSTTQGGQLLRMQMAPVLGSGQAISGFVLTMENVTQSIAVNSRRDLLLQSLTEGTRAALANIRAAIETMLGYPDMDEKQRMRFTRIISTESQALSSRLDATMLQYAGYLKSQWPMEEILGADLIAFIRRRIEDKLGFATRTESVDADLWLRVDSHSLTQVFSYLASRLKEEFGIRELTFSLAHAGRFAHLDLSWRGALLPVETLTAWESEPMNTGGEATPITLKEVTDRHGGDVWYQVEQQAERAYYRLALPVAEAAASTTAAPSSTSQPEYYDFDLFQQPGQNPELDQRLLSALTYTVFDTETTGLQPSQGDEIISIGAVRIVNGRLLQQEIFDQLIDPRRPLPTESTAIHGITAEMLEGQPGIEAILPAFHRFSDDTVLVGHNAAFDMRFLQMKEASTGIRFIQPVLDTLLLSEVIHPNQDQHKLEAIAERLGITITGRHTALGDAMVTGEVFLRMLPLLADKGIHTLGDAREAAKKTVFARVQY